MSDSNINYLSYWGNLYTWLDIFYHYNVFVFENTSYLDFPRGKLNRTHILSSQGILQLSIPIQGGRKNKQLFKDIKIDYNTHWAKHHYRSIISCYGKAPWWNEYEQDIQKIYQQQKFFLLEWNTLIYEWIAGILKCKINYVSEASFIKKQHLTQTLPIYQQVFGHEFYDEVCILDAILCLGEKELIYYLQQYRR